MSTIEQDLERFNDMTPEELSAEALRQAARQSKSSERMCGPIPKRYQQGLEGLRPLLGDETVDRAVKWVQDFDPDKECDGFYICGPQGTGKTGIALGIAMAVKEQGFTVEHWTMSDLLTELRHSYNPHSDVVEFDFIRAFRGCDLLVLDDLGQERMTDHTAQTLYNVVNWRYAELKTIIVTSNLPGKELLIKAEQNKLANDFRRIVSRFCEMLKPWALEGTDLRKAK